MERVGGSRNVIPLEQVFVYGVPGIGLNNQEVIAAHTVRYPEAVGGGVFRTGSQGSRVGEEPEQNVIGISKRLVNRKNRPVDPIPNEGRGISQICDGVGVSHVLTTQDPPACGWVHSRDDKIREVHTPGRHNVCIQNVLVIEPTRAVSGPNKRVVSPGYRDRHVCQPITGAASDCLGLVDSTRVIDTDDRPKGTASRQSNIQEDARSVRDVPEAVVVEIRDSPDPSGDAS